MFPETAYTFELAAATTIDAVAARIFPAVFRTDFAQPGFALIGCPGEWDSRTLRRGMLEFRRALDGLLHAQCGRRLSVLSLGRFDQQNTTKFHLDGAPPQAVLMLGYEPSLVASRLSLADYIRCAVENQIEPERMLGELNHMFPAGATLLEPYATVLSSFRPAAPYILLINNSTPVKDGVAPHFIGVMHKAEIVTPDPSQRRIVNSAMLAVEATQRDQVDDATRQRFLNNDDISELPKG